MPRTERGRWLLGLGATAVAAIGLLAWALAALQASPEGPVPVALDRETCARCRMLISELPFAAQLHLADGSLLHFDDPGCLLLHVHEHAPRVRSAWFHDRGSERWLSQHEVVFVASASTPMGYGLGARSGVEGLSWQAAVEHTLAREAGRSGPQ